MHCFDHHDGIVDHDPDGQHQRKQRDQVERNAEILHENKGSDQRNRYRNGRYQRRPPVAKKKEDHQSDQYKSFHERVHHLLHRSVKKFGDIIADLIVHPLWKRSRPDLLQFSLHILDHLAGV